MKYKLTTRLAIVGVGTLGWFIGSLLGVVGLPLGVVTGLLIGLFVVPPLEKREHVK